MARSSSQTGGVSWEDEVAHWERVDLARSKMEPVRGGYAQYAFLEEVDGAKMAAIRVIQRELWTKMGLGPLRHRCDISLLHQDRRPLL